MDKLLKWIFIILVIVSGIYTVDPCIEYLTTSTAVFGTPSENLTKSELEETRDGYTITYELNGGELNKENKNTYGIFSAFTLNNPTKEGYQFTGWTGSNGNTPKIKITICQGSSGDLHFIANYTPIYKETILNVEPITKTLYWNCDSHFTKFELFINGNSCKILENINELSINDLSEYLVNGKNTFKIYAIADDITLKSNEVSYTYYSEDYNVNMYFFATLDKTTSSYILKFANDDFVEYSFNGTFIDSSILYHGDFNSDRFFASLTAYENRDFYIGLRNLTMFELIIKIAEQTNGSTLELNLSDEFYLIPSGGSDILDSLPNLNIIFSITYNFDQAFIPEPEPDPEPDLEPEIELVKNIEWDSSSKKLSLQDISDYNQINVIFNSNGGILTFSLLTTDLKVLNIIYSTNLINGKTISGSIYDPLTQITTNVTNVEEYSKSISFRINHEFSFVLANEFWGESSWHPYSTALEYLYNEVYNNRQLEAIRLNVDILYHQTFIK